MPGRPPVSPRCSAIASPSMAGRRRSTAGTGAASRPSSRRLHARRSRTGWRTRCSMHRWKSTVGASAAGTKPMSRPTHGFDLFRCPVCRADLTLAARTLRCPQRHSFDLARTGYVNLLTGHGAVPAEGGDGPQQLARRDASLAQCHCDGIPDAIREHLPPATLTMREAGCGSAYHLHRLAGPGIVAGLDVSKDAAAYAAKR